MIYFLNLLLKRWTRAKQRRWAQSLAERLQPTLPLGVYCRATGWMPGCEPLTNFRRLEWVRIWVDAGPNMTYERELTYPDNPTPGQVARIAEELTEDCAVSA